jgi:hypothetical protein
MMQMNPLPLTVIGTDSDKHSSVLQHTFNNDITKNPHAPITRFFHKNTEQN